MKVCYVSGDILQRLEEFLYAFWRMANDLLECSVTEDRRYVI